MKGQSILLLIISLASSLSLVKPWGFKSVLQPISTKFSKTHAALIAVSLYLPLIHVPEAVAFDNAIPNAYTMPKSKGPAPTNLGIDTTGKLRMCLKASPNCFSTTPDLLGEDGEASNPWGDDVHAIPLWQFTKGSPATAYKLIGETLDNYIPGQSDIDGGGFKIITRDSGKRYYYVQYESLKRGYIDDLEIAVNDDSSVQAVSSSRLGYLDFHVNAKRLNYLTEQLRKEGFAAPEITPKTHPVYFDSNHDVVRASSKEPGLGLGKKKY